MCPMAMSNAFGSEAAVGHGIMVIAPLPASPSLVQVFVLKTDYTISIPGHLTCLFFHCLFLPCCILPLINNLVCAGKATLITVAGMVVGAGLGGLVESWLRVDIVPVLGIGSPTVVVSEFVLFSLWASSLYLR